VKDSGELPELAHLRVYFPEDETLEEAIFKGITEGSIQKYTDRIL
jgi:hypothetical protein